MAKPKGKFLNTQEDRELNSWLARNDYRQTKNKESCENILKVLSPEHVFYLEKENVEL